MSPKKPAKRQSHDAVGSLSRVTGGFPMFNPRPFHEPWFSEETEAILAEVERDWLDWYDGTRYEDLESRAGIRVGEVLLRRSRSDL